MRSVSAFIHAIISTARVSTSLRWPGPAVGVVADELQIGVTHRGGHGGRGVGRARERGHDGPIVGAAAGAGAGIGGAVLHPEDCVVPRSYGFRRSLQVEPGGGRLARRSEATAWMSPAQDDERVAPDLDLVNLFGVEQDVVAVPDGPAVLGPVLDLGPRQALAHLGGGRIRIPRWSGGPLGIDLTGMRSLSIRQLLVGPGRPRGTARPCCLYR